MMDQEQLQKLLKENLGDTIKDVVSQTVEEQVAPLKEQATDNAGPAIHTSKTESRGAAPKSGGIGAARFVRALAYGKGDPEKAQRYAEKIWNDDLGKHVSKALAADDFNAGGFIVPPDFSNELIELLRSENVVRSAGARTIQLPNGSLTIPRQTSSASASYVGENQAVNASQPSGGQLTLSAKKLMGTVPVSNELLQFDVGNTADMMVRDDLLQVLGTTEDKAFLRSDGTGGEPKGIRYWAANTNSSNGDTLSDIRADLQALYFDLVGNDVSMRSPALFMSEREKSALQFSVVDNEGRLIFANELSQNGTIMGWPVFTTTNIPTNLGSGSDSEVYLVDMADALIGEAGGIELDVSDEAVYQDPTGTNQSAFALDQTVVRAKLKNDFGLRHDESASVLTGVTWGA